MKKNLIITIIVAVVVGALSFYGGWQYGQKQIKNARGNFNPQGGMIANGARRGNSTTTAGIINGDIISKDDKSMTLKLRDGGSKIILLSSSTQIVKQASSSVGDLQVGDSVMANGTTNADGSLTAQMVQLRPQTK